MFTQTVAAEVRAHLARKQISSREIAELVGLTPSQMSRRINGSIAFTVEEIGEVAKALGVTVSSLYGEGDLADRKEAVA